MIKEYIPRFYEEISNAYYGVDRISIKYFKSQVIAEKINIRTGKPLGKNFSKHKTEYDMFKSAIDNIFNVRFIYEMSFLEAFLKDYLNEQNKSKSNVDSQWKILNRDNNTVNKNKSTSLSNLSFVQFMIKELFNKDLMLSELQKELGTLRNCIMHSGGIISSERDLDGLENIISKLKLKHEIGEKIRLNEMVYNEIFGFSLDIILKLKD